MAAVSRSGIVGAHDEELLLRVAKKVCRRYDCWHLLEELIDAGDAALSRMRHETRSGPKPAGELIKCVRELKDAMLYRLVEENAGLVHHIAAKLCGRGSDIYDDLVQVGMEAFVVCARKYKRCPSQADGLQGRRVAKLTTVAYKRVAGEIINHLRANAFNGINVSRRTRDIAKTVRQLHDEIMETEGWKPSVEEIAAKKELPVEDVVAALELTALCFEAEDFFGDEQEPLRGVRDERPLPDEAAARREMTEIVDRVVGALPEKYRKPILLVYFEELTVEQAAECLGCPVGTVKSRLRRARRMMRKRLRDFSED